MSKLILINQSPSRLKDMIGYNCHTRKLIKLPFQCVRKPPIQTVKTPHFCFVSNPNLVDSKYVDPFMWLHCYRKPGRIRHSAPKYLFPESNFLDTVCVPTFDRCAQEYDYFYFTIAGPKGVRYKGLDVFENLLPCLLSMKLKGLMIVYNVSRVDRVPNHMTYRNFGVTVRAGRQNRATVATIMASCKFGLFPNKEDCSPRMIPECFLQNRPAIVNRQILGGWHYFKHKQFGAMFKPGDIQSFRSAVDHVTSLEYNQRSLWMQRYGFNKYSRKLADLIKKHYGHTCVQDITHAYFADFKAIFKKAPEIFSCE